MVLNVSLKGLDWWKRAMKYEASYFWKGVKNWLRFGVGIKQRKLIWLLLVGLRTMTWKLWFQYLWFWFGKWCWDGCVKILKAYGKRTWWWLSFWLVGKESLGGVWMVQFGWLSHIVFYGAFPDLILFFFKTLLEWVAVLGIQSFFFLQFMF